jgi:beta-N-acetylhexosaminidase
MSPRSSHSQPGALRPVSTANARLRTLAGQLLTFGFDGTTLTPELRSTLRDLQPGGVILFARNITDAHQTHGLLRAVQKHSERPLFRCVDLEGGTVDRLRDVLGPAPSVQDVVAGGPAVYREHGQLLGAESSALGFNVDFAPVLDLRLPSSLAVLGSRTVSADPAATARYARAFLLGLRDEGIVGCGKHFPGLGEAALDTHKDLPSISKSWKELWAQDLEPYRMLARQLPFVMVAHCAYPQVTGKAVPASLSRKWIDGILRKKIGYTGLVVSDDLEMGGVMNGSTVEEAAIGTILAGADCYLVCHNSELVHRAAEAVVAEAERSKVFRARVETAARRVLMAKRRWKALQRPFPAAPTEVKLNKLRQWLWAYSETLRLAAIARQQKAGGPNGAARSGNSTVQQ